MAFVALLYTHTYTSPFQNYNITLLSRINTPNSKCQTVLMLICSLPPLLFWVGINYRNTIWGAQEMEQLAVSPNFNGYLLR